MQLPMFVDPSEIVELTIMGEWGSIDSVNTKNHWKYKLENALDRGGHFKHNFWNIGSWDVFVPVTLQFRSQGRVFVGNGHHRIAASEYAGMPLIPVVWDEHTYHSGYPSRYGAAVEHDFT